MTRKKSVNRFSSLNYLEVISKEFYSKTELTLEDILNTIATERMNIEIYRLSSNQRIVRNISDINFWKNKLRKRAEETLRFLLRINLLKKENDTIFFTKDFKLMGKYFLEEDLPEEIRTMNQGKVILLDKLYNSQQPFNPSRFLIPIRNNSIKDTNIEYIIRDKFSPRKDEVVKDSLKLNLDGVIENTEHYYKNLMNTNILSFQVMIDWGKYFNLVNTYNIKIPSNIEIKIIKPTTLVYLTIHLFTLKELLDSCNYLLTKNEITKYDLIQYVNKKNTLILSEISGNSLLLHLERLKLITITGNNVTPINVNLNLHNLMDSLNANKYQMYKVTEDVGHLVNNVDEQELDSAYLFLYPIIDKKTFYNEIERIFFKLTGPAQSFLPIPLFREHTCLELRISNYYFDKLLRQVAKERRDKIGFSKLPLRFTTQRGGLKFGEGIIINNELYYLISIRR